VSELGAAEVPSVENERVCDEFIAPQSPPALGKASRPLK
jgi:WD40 repeat protein